MYIKASGRALETRRDETIRGFSPRAERHAHHWSGSGTFSTPRRATHAQYFCAACVRACVRACVPCVRTYCPSLFSTSPDDGGRERKIDRATTLLLLPSLDSRKVADHTLRPIVTLCRTTDQSGFVFPDLRVDPSPFVNSAATARTGVENRRRHGYAA